MAQFISQIMRRLYTNAFFRHQAALYGVTFLIVLPLLCKDIRYSVYFTKYMTSDQGKELMRRENDERLQAAQKYFQDVTPGEIQGLLKRIGPSATADSKQAVALSVITVSRNRHIVDEYQPKYLTQVLWRLLDLANSSLTRIQASNYTFSISLCNVDFDPAHYEEINLFRSIIPVFSRFTSMSLSIDHPFEKEKQDYVYCLNTSLHSSPTDFVFLLEDDAYPHEDFFPVILNTLEHHFSYSSSHISPSWPSNPSRTLYIKFYHPERLSRFHWTDVITVFELLGWVMLVGTLLHILYCYFRGSSMNSLSSWLWFCIYSLLLALAVDRPGLMELRRLCLCLYHILPAPSCCTPAMLFPASSANATATYMNNITCGNSYGKDSVLDDFIKLSGTKAYLVQPNIVLHIGMYSALRSNIVDPFLM